MEQKNTSTLREKPLELLFSESQIKMRVKALATQIEETTEAPPVWLVVLKGAFVFATHLAEEYSQPHITFSFIKLSSYEGTKTTGKVTTILGLNENEIKNRDVLIVEDIVDTGITLNHLIGEVQKLNPKRIRVATMLLKPTALQHRVSLDFIGFEIPNHFVVGYGMDYDELGRNLNSIYYVKD